MNLIVGKQPLEASKSEMIDLLSCRSGLKSEIICLLIDAFSLFLRKLIVQQGYVTIRGVGRFYVKPNKVVLAKRRYYTVGFFPFDRIKERVKGRSDLIGHVIYRKQLKTISKMFGISFENVVFLYKLYLSSIAFMLKKYGVFRFHKIGTFKLDYVDSFANKYITKKQGYTKPIFLIRFECGGCLFKEINKNTKKYIVIHRLLKMLYLIGESVDIEQREYDEKINYKKVEVRRKRKRVSC